MNFLNEKTKAYHHNPETAPSINEPELCSWVEMCLKLIRRLPSVKKPQSGFGDLASNFHHGDVANHTIHASSIARRTDTSTRLVPAPNLRR